jgi:glycosyltransferase involved in cell wall biosynthesis
MRIAQIATVGSPVTSGRPDSIELVVWTLTEQLIALGHDVTLFATADSETSGRLVSVLEGGYDRANGPIGDWLACEWMNLCAAVERASEFDVLHSHAYLYGLPLTRSAGKPFVHTHHVAVAPDQYEFARRYPEGHITALSRYQWRQYPDVPLLAVIPHGLDTDLLPFQSQPQDYLCFLGRLLEDKGPLLAIELARRAGIPLLIAGPKSDYFEQEVRPLVDGKFVRYLGPVYGEAKARLLGGARALIYPLRSPEPFGLVMIEAMLSGTPVAALGLGAVPEVVDQGVTGCYANSLDELASLMPQVLQLERGLIRQRAEQRFSARRMAEAYAAAYARIV